MQGSDQIKQACLASLCSSHLLYSSMLTPLTKSNIPAGGGGLSDQLEIILTQPGFAGVWAELAIIDN